MKEFQIYLKKGLIKHQRPNFKQIKQQLEEAGHDLKLFDTVIREDTGWASTIAYQSMLRAGRALMFAHGFLPIDGQQHKTVVELTGELLGETFKKIVRQFDKLRRVRNAFLYDSMDTISKTEAEIAVKTARKLLTEITKQIEKLNPQGNIFNADRDNNGKGIKIDEFLKKL
jgi:uncharacterized protein (UPF0332 family)